MSENELSTILLEIIRSFSGTKKGAKYYIQAITRTAFLEESNQKKEDDQNSLATIGDSVLDFLVAEKLFLDGKKTKGEITEIRKRLVENKSLHKIALDISLQKLIIWGSDEEERKIWLKGIISLATSLEAVFGGLFLAKGYNVTKKLFKIIFTEERIRKLKLMNDQ